MAISMIFHTPPTYLVFQIFLFIVLLLFYLLFLKKSTQTQIWVDEKSESAGRTVSFMLPEPLIVDLQWVDHRTTRE